MSDDSHSWVNSKLVDAEYAVRGPLLLRCDEITAELKKNPDAFPFDRTIPCNIGNPQAMLQKPITFYRELTALISCPSLLTNEKFLSSGAMNTDVIERAQKVIENLGHPNKTGAYTESLGYEWIRTRLCEVLEKRDEGVKAVPHNIFLTDGASPGIKVLLNLLISDPNDGIMIPIPQYPLYTATIAMLGGKAVEYYLQEEGGWKLDVEEMKRAYDESRAKGINVKAVAIINPGNPTGNVLSLEDVKNVCAFAEERGLLLLSDEVYQENVYRAEDKFHSAKKVMGQFYPKLPLVSFHSISKGVIGECGKRGGYMEVANVPQLMHDVLVKMASVSLCPNVNGQILVDAMMNPPQEGDVSHPSWRAEYDALLGALKEKAQMLTEGLNKAKGIHTEEITGAMYAFPSLTLPSGFVEEAAKVGRKPDAHWCFRLMETTGIVVVPGSGFGQKKGTHHFRITILPQTETLKEVIAKITKFQDELFAEHSDK